MPKPFVSLITFSFVVLSQHICSYLYNYCFVFCCDMVAVRFGLLLPVKRLVKKIIPEMSYNVPSGMSSHTITNKYASCPDWRSPHMPIAVTVSGGQFVTRASRLPGQFVTPG